jgi:hypothetical protein|tara:strand:+ start:1317 stop:1598 length:282 start_codon:yes stop_codon:yes gene_type:complete
MKLKELRELVRMGLGNIDREVVSDQEIDFYINRAQKKINKMGLLNRVSASANSVKDQERYNLPSDLVNILRVDYDGDKIDVVDYNDIIELDVT